MPPGWDAAVQNENAQHPVAKRTKSVVLSSQSSERGQGLTLVHFSAQLEPCLTQEDTLQTLNTPLTPP
jgi:hypothetical protein